MTIGLLAALVLMPLALICGADCVRAQDDPAATIRSALEQWRLDFNARRTDRICELFDPALRYDFQGLPEQNYTLLCDRLHTALADRSRTIEYGLRIKEIIVSGSMAIVRLTWISTTTGSDGVRRTDDEQGLDVFQKQGDGSWKIVRYIAYPDRP
jgi:steroid delta-isomerase